MIKKLQKRGNSHALVFDTALMEQLGIQPDTLLQISVTGGSLVVSPIFSGAGKQSVDEALREIRAQSGYTEMLSNLAK